MFKKLLYTSVLGKMTTSECMCVNIPEELSVCVYVCVHGESRPAITLHVVHMQSDGVIWTDSSLSSAL